MPKMDGLQCDPVPPFVKCVRTCQGAVQKHNTTEGTALGSWGEAMYTGCLTECRREYLAKPMPGCLKKDGGVVGESIFDKPIAPGFPRYYKAKRWIQYVWGVPGVRLSTSMITLVVATAVSAHFGLLRRAARWVDPSGELETCGLDWRRQGAALVRAVHVRVAGWISEARSRTARREAEADAALLDPRAEREEEVEMT
eukprot:Polyplicarium_translucidae@DN3096_c0_g2_i2.p1